MEVSPPGGIFFIPSGAITILDYITNNLNYCLECNICDIKYLGQPKIEYLIGFGIISSTTETIKKPLWLGNFASDGETSSPLFTTQMHQIVQRHTKV